MMGNDPHPKFFVSLCVGFYASEYGWSAIGIVNSLLVLTTFHYLFPGFSYFKVELRF